MKGGAKVVLEEERTNERNMCECEYTGRCLPRTWSLGILGILLMSMMQTVSAFRFPMQFEEDHAGKCTVFSCFYTEAILVNFQPESLAKLFVSDTFSLLFVPSAVSVNSIRFSLPSLLLFPWQL